MHGPSRGHFEFHQTKCHFAKTGPVGGPEIHRFVKIIGC